MKMHDPIVDEMRVIRDALAKEYDYSVEKLARALQAEEAKSGHKVVHLSPRPVAASRKAS